MKKTRKKYPASFKSRVVTEAFRGEASLSKLATKYDVHSTVIHRWKKEAQAAVDTYFSGKLGKHDQHQETEVKELQTKIGQLTVERNNLGKCLHSLNTRRRQEIIDPSNEMLSITAQCKLLSISRSGWYYTPKGESPLNLKLMDLIKEQFSVTPSYGSRRMEQHLRGEGYCVGRHRVRRLMRLLGLQAKY